MTLFERRSLLAVAAVLTAGAVSCPTYACAEGAGSQPVQVVEPTTGGVENLPFSQGHSFARLDDYLAYLAGRGAQDVPWYAQVGPDKYQLMGRLPPGEPPRYFTRAELMAKFGFKQ